MDSIAAGGAHRVAGLSLDRIRSDFPLLSRTVGGSPLVYLDNAATSQKPRAVIDAVTRFYAYENANVHRAIHRLGEEATAAFEAARERVRTLLHAAKASEIVFTHGTTESINLVAQSWGRSKLHAGDIVLLSGMEHHSDIVPWQLVATERGCTIRSIPVEEDGTLDVGKLERNWGERIRIVCVTQASNVLGTVNDIKAIVEIAHAHGALVLVDGAQSVPHLSVDVQDLGCDFLAFSSHKLYGPMGMGVLYGKESLLDAMPPWMGGGEMIRSVELEHSTWNELPWKFEAGTPNVAGAVGLGAAIAYIESLGFARIAQIEAELSAHAAHMLGGLPGLRLFGQAPRRVPVFSFELAKVHAHDLAQYLDQEGIAVRAGHHCAQPLMRSLGVPATVRASLAFYNTKREIDYLGEALEGAARFYA